MKGEREPELGPPALIDEELLIKIHFWCDALYRYTQRETDQALLVDLYEKATKFKYMSPIGISEEINLVIKLYKRLEPKRDDILMGLEAIALASEKEYSGAQQ